MEIDMTAEEDYIIRVVDCLPHDAELRSRVRMDVSSHIAERLERGQALDEVLPQLGDPVALAESYLSAEPLRAGSFWARGGAKALDLLVYLGVVVPLAFVLWKAIGPPMVFSAPILVLIYPVYLMVTEYRYDQTLGKRWLDLRVVQESGARITLGQAFVRQLPQFLQIFWIDIMFALFTERSQRAFEILSRTRVVTVANGHSSAGQLSPGAGQEVPASGPR
jgi:uncharacterized RDD family membrane protein YckC